ncbi:cell adhesion molecule CEACAM8-like isoform X2 [Macrotis lagotis]|uniref:cell adhesion molecule CEACAM8-like isoform X2 n=1 Tax=Macrotis lagotis TaxID=92651 RepID=UPI003D686DB1
MMKSHSRTPHSQDSARKGLLVATSIVSWCIQTTPVQSDSITIMPNPPNGTVGSSVTLDIHGFLGNAFSYNWYRKTTDSSNRFVAYHIPTRVQIPENKRERVFPNGSLLIPNLTLNDTDVYIVQIVDSKGVIAVTARGQLAVNEEESTERDKGSSLSKWAITGFFLAGAALTGGLIYFLFFGKTGGASENHLPEDQKSSTPNHKCENSRPGHELRKRMM